MADKPQNALLSFLLGRWLGHPLHPALVHVPIALWLGALFFDILAWCNVGGNSMVRGAYWAILSGLVSTLIVVPAGIAEWTQIKRDRSAWTLALWHMILNLVVTVLLAASLCFRSGDAYGEDRAPAVAMGLCLAGNLVLMVSGYVGGRLVYDQGIGVARLSKHKWRKLAAAGHNHLPPDA